MKPFFLLLINSFTLPSCHTPLPKCHQTFARENNNPMQSFRLKAYTSYGLITSKKMYNDYQIEDALLELSMYTTIRKVYKSDGKKSSEVRFILKDQKTRPIYYTRPDGTKTYTLSIHPSNYPMTAFYADGSYTSIGLS